MVCVPEKTELTCDFQLGNRGKNTETQQWGRKKILDSTEMSRNLIQISQDAGYRGHEVYL